MNYRAMQVCFTIFCFAALCLGQQTQPAQQTQSAQPNVATQDDLNRVQSDLNQKLSTQQGQMDKLGGEVKDSQKDIDRIKTRQTQQENRQAEQEKQQAAQDAEIRNTNNAVNNLGNDQKNGFRSVWYGVGIIAFVMFGGAWFFLHDRKRSRKAQRAIHGTVAEIGERQQTLENAVLVLASSDARANDRDYEKLTIRDPHRLLASHFRIPKDPKIETKAIRSFAETMQSSGLPGGFIALVHLRQEDIYVPCVVDSSTLLAYESAEEYDQLAPNRKGMSLEQRYKIAIRAIQPPPHKQSAAQPSTTIQ